MASHVEACQVCKRRIQPPAVALLHEGSVLCSACHDRVQPHCPYCRELLPACPRRAQRCEKCSNTFHVRSTQTLFPSTILTVDQMLIVDAVGDLANHGVTEAVAKQMIQRLAATNSRQPTGSEVVWSLFRTVSDGVADLSERQALHLCAARLLIREGRDPYGELAAAMRCRLQSWRESGVVKQVYVMASGDPCVECLRQVGKKFTIDEALRELPVPCRACTTKIDPRNQHGWCKCDMNAVHED